MHLLKPYHRADIGFSLKVWDESWLAKKPQNPFRFTKSSWISLEIFNLMDVQNEASRTWIKTIFNQQYAIPNHLTSRRINLRWRAGTGFIGDEWPKGFFSNLLGG